MLVYWRVCFFFWGGGLKENEMITLYSNIFLYDFGQVKVDGTSCLWSCLLKYLYIVPLYWITLFLVRIYFDPSGHVLNDLKKYEGQSSQFFTLGHLAWLVGTSPWLFHVVLEKWWFPVLLFMNKIMPLYIVSKQQSVHCFIHPYPYPNWWAVHCYDQTYGSIMYMKAGCLFDLIPLQEPHLSLEASLPNGVGTDFIHIGFVTGLWIFASDGQQECVEQLAWFWPLTVFTHVQHLPCLEASIGKHVSELLGTIIPKETVGQKLMNYQCIYGRSGDMIRASKLHTALSNSCSPQCIFVREYLVLFCLFGSYLRLRCSPVTLL